MLQFQKFQKVLGSEGRKERETCEKHNRGLFGMAGSGKLARDSSRKG